MTNVQARIVTADETGLRLDRWFKRHFPQVGHGQLQKLFRTGQVRVDGKRVDGSARLEEGQAIRVPPLPKASEKTSLTTGVKKGHPATPSAREAAYLQSRVLYKDDDILIINKPAGLAVQGGTGTTKHLDALLDTLRFDSAERPRLVHRLDRDTSGVLVLARTVKAASDLGRLFRFGDVRKYYWAVTIGVPKPVQGKIDLPLSKKGGPGAERMAADYEEGKDAVTLYQVVESAGHRAAWVALWPLTGRTHQLRAHMAAIKTPLLGDGKYAGQGAFLTGAELPRALHLHARRIIFAHPRTGRAVDVSAPLPPHMEETWQYFGFDRHDDGDPFAQLK